ncbi:MAG TPA: glycoside hydrolase family 2 TIM barrel-domain containing protein [Solirubrobacteraceae bacterium]
MRTDLSRGILAISATLVVALLAAPRVGIDRAQGAGEDLSAIQLGAVPSIIAGGSPGRVALGGPWTLRSDRNAHGASKGWQTGAFVGSVVGVPNAANADRVTGEEGIKSFKGTIGWYSTRFDVPEDGVYAIRFESVNHRASVYLDGRYMGSHTGTYLPFEFVAQLSKARPHTLVVRADWRNPLEMKRNGWHRMWFNFGGINREVTLRKLAASEISAPTLNTRLQPDGSARVDISAHVRNRSAVTRPIGVRGSLSRDGEDHAFDLGSKVVPAGGYGVLRTTITVPQPKLWSPQAANLYTLSFNVPDETSYETRTGLRELRKSGRRLLLNGKPVILHGASLQEDAKGSGDAMSAAEMDAVIRQLKELGANATRSQHPLHPALLERLDAAGIMVWQGIGPVDAPGAWTSVTAKMRARAKRRVRQSFFQAQIHPSVIAWNLANEVAGNGHDETQARYIDEMARELHRRDPGRLVALDVWGAHPPKVAGAMYKNIDAVGDTNYIGWYQDLHNTRAARRAIIRNHITEFAKTFKGKIVVVTEFGAEANSLNDSRAPGGYRFQADLLRDHIEVYDSLPFVSGHLVWNLRDFAVSPAFAGGSIRRQVPDIKLVRGINQKGLFTYDGRPKLAVSVVRALDARHTAAARQAP